MMQPSDAEKAEMLQSASDELCANFVMARLGVEEGVSGQTEERIVINKLEGLPTSSLKSKMGHIYSQRLMGAPIPSQETFTTASCWTRRRRLFHPCLITRLAAPRQWRTL
jgi:hypothetical protein